MKGKANLAAAAIFLALPASAGFEAGMALRENLFYSGRPLLVGPGIPGKGYWVSGTFGRANLNYLSDPWTIESAVELGMIWNSSDIGEAGSSRAGGSPLGSRAFLERVDLTVNPASGSDTDVQVRVERLKVSRSFGAFDVDFGRQPVSLGTSHFVGVLDVLAPFPPGDLDSTYKPGVDAVRARMSICEDGEAEIIGVGADPWRESAVVGRVRQNVKSLDFEIVAGKFRRRLFGGAGWEGDAGPVAIWGEIALFERRIEKEIIRGGGRDAAFSGVAGADWRPGKNMIVGGAVFYQDFGARRASELISVSMDAPFQEGWAFLTSRSYLVATFHAEPHALVHADIAGMVNLVDGSTLWQPRVTWSVHDNADLSFYGWVKTGRRPSGAVPRSEFGSMANGAGVYARIFL